MKVHLNFYDETERIMHIGLFVAISLIDGKIIRNEFEDPYCDTEFDSLISYLRTCDYNNFAVVLVEDPDELCDDEEDDDEFGYLGS